MKKSGRQARAATNRVLDSLGEIFAGALVCEVGPVCASLCLSAHGEQDVQPRYATGKRVPNKREMPRVRARK